MSGSAETLHPVQREKINWVDLHSRASSEWLHFIFLCLEIYISCTWSQALRQKKLEKQSRTKKHTQEKKLKQFLQDKEQLAVNFQECWFSSSVII